MATKTRWSIDPGHSEIRFKVKHLAIANVSGIFKSFEGHAETEGTNFEHAAVSFEMDANSVDTNNTVRDNHLRSDLFLNAAAHPKIVFAGILQKHNPDDYRLDGDLTILNTKRRIIFQVEHIGVGNGRFNDVRAGFELRGRINRKEYGLDVHLLNEAGNLVVGDDIKIECAVELIQIAGDAPL